MFSYPGARANQARNRHRKPQQKGPPPSLSKDPSAWFDYFDADHSRNLSQEEIIQGLVISFHATSAHEQQSIRESIYNTWPVFDLNGSGTIDKYEFLMKGGMAESLIAMERQRHAPPVHHQPYHNQPATPYSQPPPPQQQQPATTLMRVPIPPGMHEGQKVRVRAPGSGELITVRIPNRISWGGGGGGNSPLYFDVHVPIQTPPSVQGSVIPQKLPPYTPFYAFQSPHYTAPQLGLQRVTYPTPASATQPNGRRKALLIGINYRGTRAELRGCVNDVKNMKQLLLRNGFQDTPSNMVILTDDRQGTDMPTKHNIQKGFDWLVHNVAPGDVLFFHFSGHGAQVPDKSGTESDGYNETILPVDYQNAGQIVDDEIWGRMVIKLPSGVRLTAIMDCCHSGTGLDLPYDYNIRSNRWVEDLNPAHSQGDVVLFSGCEDSQTSADVMSKYQAGGAMTNAFLGAYDGRQPFTRFLEALHYQLKKRGFKQRPQLTSSQSFDVHRVFNLTDGVIYGNANSNIGRDKRRHVKPGKANNGQINDLLFQGAAIIGAFALADALF